MLAPLVKAVTPPAVPARPPGVSLGAAPIPGPSPPRVLLHAVVSLPAVAGGSGRRWGRSGGLEAGYWREIRVLPCPEKVVGDDALGDQVVCCKAAGLEQDVGARTPVGDGDWNILVAPSVGAAPQRRGRPALVARRRRRAAVTSSSSRRRVAAASAGPRLLHGTRTGELRIQAFG
jgi:hypothetical protein